MAYDWTGNNVMQKRDDRFLAACIISALFLTAVTIGALLREPIPMRQDNPYLLTTDKWQLRL
jgi:type IV secretory pathway component VirB8